MNETGGDKADDPSTTADPLELVAAGTFREDFVHPIEIHYGFTDDKSPGWELAGIVEIEYDDTLANKAVIVPVPEDEGRALLGFVIKIRDGFREGFGMDLFVDLAAPQGSLVSIPISNHAPFPFAPECYGIHVDNIRPGEDQVEFDGKLSHIFYGFTSASAEDYVTDNNVPWENLFGEDTAEGMINPVIQHDGGFKGTIRFIGEWVFVPAGKNLVFKPAINKFTGSCPNDGDTSFVEFTETKTFFKEVSM